MASNGWSVANCGERFARSWSVKMTEKYAHLAPENLRAGVNVLDGVSRNCHTNFNVTELGETNTLIRMVGGIGFEPTTPAV